MFILAKVFLYFISMVVMYDLVQFDISIWSKLGIFVGVIIIDLLVYLEEG